MFNPETQKEKNTQSAAEKAFGLPDFEGKERVKKVLRAGSLLALNLFMAGQNFLPSTPEVTATTQPEAIETVDKSGLYREIDTDEFVRDPGHIEYTFNKETGELMCGETVNHVVDDTYLDAEMVIDGQVHYVGETDGYSIVSHKYLDMAYLVSHDYIRECRAQIVQEIEQKRGRFEKMEDLQDYLREHPRLSLYTSREHSREDVNSGALQAGESIYDNYKEFKEIPAYALPIRLADTAIGDAYGLEGQSMLIYVLGRNEEGLRPNASGTSGSEIRLETGEEIGFHSATTGIQSEDRFGTTEKYEEYRDWYLQENPELRTEFENLLQNFPDIREDLEADFGPIESFEEAVNKGVEFAIMSAKTVSTLEGQLKTFDEEFPAQVRQDSTAPTSSTTLP